MPQVPLPSVPVKPIGSPEASERANSNSVGVEDDIPEAEYGSSYGCGELGFASVDWWWNLYGLSPDMIAAVGNGFNGGRYDAEELRYWGQLRRAADYIFGYSQGFGERRIGVDSYGIPIYAYKMCGTDTVHGEIEPMRTEKLDYYSDYLHHETWPSTYNNRQDESCRFSNLSNSNVKHHPEEPLNTEVDSVPLPYAESRKEVNLYENLGMDSYKHYYGGAQNVQLEAVESSHQILSYPDANWEISYTDSNGEPSYKELGNENNSFTNTYYEGREYQRSSHVEPEPYRTSWAQYPENYGIAEEISSYSEVDLESSSPRSACQTSSLGEWGNEGKLCSSEYAFQTHHDDHCLELEPFKPSWMLNLNYYDTHEEVSSPY